MQVQALLERQPREVVTIDNGCTVAEAVNLMAASRSDALIITSDGQPWGVFSARDLVGCHLRDPQRSLRDMTLAEGSAPAAIWADPADEVGTVLERMQQADLHYLPVVRGARAIALLTVWELVRLHLDNLNAELQHLETYIKDLQAAACD